MRDSWWWINRRILLGFVSCSQLKIAAINSLPITCPRVWTYMNRNRRRTNRNRVCWSTYRWRSFFSSFRTKTSTAAIECLPGLGTRPMDLRSSDSPERFRRKYSGWSCAQVLASTAGTFCSAPRWRYSCQSALPFRNLFSLADQRVRHP